MIRLRTYFALLATLIVGGLLIGYLDPRGYTIAVPRYAGGGTVLPEPQQAGERTWLDDGFTEVRTLGPDAPGEKGLLHAPVAVKVDSRGHVYVVDGADWTVKQFSPEGRFVRSYGNGGGRGPGELASITDLEFGRDGRLWVADESARRIHLFSPGGELLRSVPTEVAPYRLAGFGPGRMVTLMLVGSDHLFGVIDRQGRLVESFGEFLDRQREHGFALDGFLSPDGRGGFVYAGLYAGILAAYSGKGELRYLKSTIGGLAPPRLFRDAQGKRWVDREAPISALSLSVSGDAIHLVSSFDSGARRLGVLDTYALADGSYLHSRRTPEGCAHAAVHGEHLFTLGEIDVTQWKIGSSLRRSMPVISPTSEQPIPHSKGEAE